MKVIKEGRAGGAEACGRELEAINAFAKTQLAENEVYCFTVLLCDNEVDRDFERFTEATLEQLRGLFTGKTGILDHDWSAAGQKARLYRCELITEPVRKNSLGAPYVYLKGWAYMLRTKGNAELIAEIEGGIKKETSVGCSVAKTVCSICGEELGTGSCTHIKGREYNGKLCCGELTGAVDAYEWSFVAVPAQKGAGVMKKTAAGAPDMEKLRKLYERAELGDRYLEQLRGETVRLALICDRALGAALEKSVSRMEPEELMELEKSLRDKAGRLLPLTAQLPGRNEITAFSGEEYKI